MLTPLTVTLAVAALLLAAWCGLAALRDQPTKDWHFGGMAVVSLLAIAQLLIATVLLARGERPAGDTTLVLVSYLLTVALCVPVTGFISLGERSRWGSATVAVGALVVPALQLRLHDIWGGGLG
ncbi:hypothetical protein [Streptomyces sp. YIM 98790]|uniref:hypothetical protein n=1 Tax=Streptomyces sp. YIM 98790 TaxID=2689077 RepID=UPI0014096491|nr:hypothetical protein [Streptomyces sp. YIM 98790]